MVDGNDVVIDVVVVEHGAPAVDIGDEDISM